MNIQNRKKFGLAIGLILLIVGLVVGIMVIQERQVRKNEAEEIPVPLKQVTCSWQTEGDYIIRLVDGQGNVIAEQRVSSGTSFTFRDLDPRTLPVPVRCEIVDPNNLSCKKQSSDIICAAPTGTPTPPPVLPGCFESCAEDETIPRCADGLECIYNTNGTKTCQDTEGILCPYPTVTITPTATPTPESAIPFPTKSPTPTLSPTPTPTTPPGQPTNTPVPPTATPQPTATPSPTPTSVPIPTPTACPIPDAVSNLALACGTSAGQCSWSASGGADYYLVTIKDENTNLPIDGYNPNKKVTGTKTDFTAVAGHSYVCYVEAVDATCGASSARKSDSCSYNPPTATPRPTTTIKPSGTPTPTDTVIVNATNTPSPSNTPKPNTTSKPTLPATGLAHDSFIIAMIFALFGFGAVLAGLLIKI